MADYSTYADMLEEIPIFAGGQEKLTETNIDDKIPKLDNLIDAALAGYYTVPFSTGASTPPIINQISTLYISSWAIGYIFYSEDPDDPRSARADDLKQQADDLIAAIISGEKKILSTASVVVARITTTAQPSSNTEETDKIFPLSEDQWEYKLRVNPPTGNTYTTTPDNEYL